MKQLNTSEYASSRLSLPIDQTRRWYLLAGASTVAPSLLNYAETPQNARLVSFSIFAGGLVILMTVTLLVWAMSCDQRFPGNHVFSQVNQRTGTPLAATLLSSIVLSYV